MILTCWSYFTKNVKNRPKITFLKVKIRVVLQKISKARKGSFEEKKIPSNVKKKLKGISKVLRVEI